MALLVTAFLFLKMESALHGTLQLTFDRTSSWTKWNEDNWIQGSKNMHEAECSIDANHQSKLPSLNQLLSIDALPIFELW